MDKKHLKGLSSFQAVRDIHSYARIPPAVLQGCNSLKYVHSFKETWNNQPLLKPNFTKFLIIFYIQYKGWAPPIPASRCTCEVLPIWGHACHCLLPNGARKVLLEWLHCKHQGEGDHWDCCKARSIPWTGNIHLSQKCNLMQIENNQNLGGLEVECPEGLLSHPAVLQQG